MSIIYHGQKVYDVLVEECGASPDSDERRSFVAWWERGGPGGEYRFMGELGFGGKVWFNPPRVTCYPEDRTLDREHSISRANERLSALVEEVHEDSPG